MSATMSTATTTPAHLPALGGHERVAVGAQLQEMLVELDAISEDVLIGVVRALEEQQWMLRAQVGRGG
jgi:hypothetical protein